MRQQGKIVKWFDDKGYGFVNPIDTNEQIFAHISAFPKLEKRPQIDEAVTFQVIKDIQKGFQAQNVLYINRPTNKKTQNIPKISDKKNNNFIFIIFLIVLVSIILFKYLSFSDINKPRAMPQSLKTTNSIETLKQGSSDSFQCANKTSCSQMSSCEEAKYYLNNCPGTIMDGDGDGLPCEDQWCGH